MAIIDSGSKLRAIIGEPSDLVRLKIHDALNASARRFVERAPMAFLATCGADGMPTVSPKGDGPGFVQVADERTLLIPERKGNKLLFSMHNVLDNPKIGMIFIVPGTCETLRVHGHAELTDDADLCERLSARGSKALLVTRIRVESCYFHCAKAFLRAQLWNPSSWAEPMRISFGEEIAQRGALAADAIEAFDAGVQTRYKTDL